MNKEINIKEKDKLDEYVAILLEWQQKMNLISSSTISNIWERHILDCLQLKNFIEGKNKNIIDFGSGAGLPGMVLAIIDPLNKYFLVDSVAKKTNFLLHVKNQLNLNNVHVINRRVENINPKSLKADYTISRAMAKLNILLHYSNKLLKIGGKAVFLKGKSFQNEINDSYNCKFINNFHIDIFKNNIESEGRIIVATKKK